MNFELNAAFSLTIGVAAVAGGIRAGKTGPCFYPFLILVWTGFLNEMISVVLICRGYYNVVNYNIYSLAEAALIVWQFRRWGLFKRQALYRLMQGGFVLWWLYESCVLNRFSYYNSWFIIGYSFAVAVLSIVTIGEMLFYEDRRLLRNAKFLICTGFIVYFAYAVLTETFWLFGLNRSKSFRIRIYELLACINLFTNLIFAIAILWMPMKFRYIKPLPSPSF
jgi:hypothetical protein